MPNIRKPTSIHVLNGTFRSDRHGDIDQQLEIESEISETPPEFLADPIARVEWLRIIDTMSKYKVLKATDECALAVYCALYAEFQTDPLEFKTTKIAALRSLMNDLGLTPQARAKIQLPEKIKKGSSFDQL